MSRKLLEHIQLVEWRAEQKLTGRQFMDTSSHTVKGDLLSTEIEYTFKVMAPPGLHPEEMVAAIRGAQITTVTEPSHQVEELRDNVRDLNGVIDRKNSEVAELKRKVVNAERMMKHYQTEVERMCAESGSRDREGKDNKAKLDALALLGTTLDEIGFEKLAKVELDHWLRGLDDFNMTSGEADELRAMLLRIARAVFARAEVLRDKPRCAHLLESIQREADQKAQVPAKAKSDDEDQLF